MDSSVECFTVMKRCRSTQITAMRTLAEVVGTKKLSGASYWAEACLSRTLSSCCCWAVVAVVPVVASPVTLIWSVEI